MSIGAHGRTATRPLALEPSRREPASKSAAATVLHSTAAALHRNAAAALYAAAATAALGERRGIKQAERDAYRCESREREFDAHGV
jgi:hypothetical protein